MSIQVASLISVAAIGFSLAAGNTSAAEWRFRVLLDQEVIGEHRFTVMTSGESRTVESRADFSVRVLGIPVYRYHHFASEIWRGNCLRQLSAETNDDGAVTQVSALLQENDSMKVMVGADVRTVPGCIMSFAYWNPELRQQKRLLNAQTGKEESVQLRRLADQPIEVRGRTLTAARWRITGTAAPVDIWYSTDGEWLGLDSTVAGTRKLSYRLQ